ncbi:MAG: AAA family ATPase [Anaerolineae bacterium]|nr:AAA family ATPase [Anaerolineae bacterium]
MKAVLLTGRPGVGKTTTIRTIVAQLGLPAGGFYSEEIIEAGQRVGFRIVTLDGRSGLLARFKLPGAKICIGKYGVTLEALETIGINSIRQGIAAGLVVIDEIGPMEIKSAAFCAAVDVALASPARILGTIVKRSTPFTDAIKVRADVEVIEITPQNRDVLTQSLCQRFKSA